MTGLGAAAGADAAGAGAAGAVFGAAGLLVNDSELVPDVLHQARQRAASGQPVLVNAILGKTDFRKGSISM